jgi:hypothetical protein
MISKRFPASKIRALLFRVSRGAISAGAHVPLTGRRDILPGMAPKKIALKEIGEMLAHVVKHMATKDDLAAVETRLDHRIDKLDAKVDSAEFKLAAKIDRLDTKLTKFEEHEIDKRLQLEVRVSAIEKHIGLDNKVAA